MMRMGAGMLAILAPLQLLFGDLHGLNTLEHQPVKVAAMEGHWEDTGPAPVVIFGIPDEERETNRAEIAIPKLGSLILTHEWDGRYPGLKDFPPEERPPVTIVFYAFRVMVILGVALIFLGLAGAYLWWRGRLFDTPWYLRLADRSWWIGFVAILAGWITTESGRQPYIVQGLLRTADAVSPVSAYAVATSLAAFVVVYCVVFTIGIHYIRVLMRRGPTGAALEPPPAPEGLPNRPLSAAQDSAHESVREAAP